MLRCLLVAQNGPHNLMSLDVQYRRDTFRPQPSQHNPMMDQHHLLSWLSHLHYNEEGMRVDTVSVFNGGPYSNIFIYILINIMQHAEVVDCHGQ